MQISRRSRRALAGLGLACAALTAYAAVPRLDEDPFGENRGLYTALQANAYFNALPVPKHALCAVQHRGDTLAIYEYVAVARGVVGTIIANFTQFTDGRLSGEPHISSGAFGGMIPLRGTRAPSHAIRVGGDSLFPLLEGKTMTLSLTRSTSRLDYACTTHYAPKRFDLGLPGKLYLVSCMRTAVSLDEAREATPQAPSYALCSNHLGFCPMHWNGHEGDKPLFDYYEVDGKRYSPVTWRCEETADDEDDE